MRLLCVCANIPLARRVTHEVIKKFGEYQDLQYGVIVNAGASLFKTVSLNREGVSIQSQHVTDGIEFLGKLMCGKCVVQFCADGIGQRIIEAVKLVSSYVRFGCNLEAEVVKFVYTSRG